MLFLTGARGLRPDQIVRCRTFSPPAGDHRFYRQRLVALSNANRSASVITIQPTLRGILNLKVLAALHAHPGANRNSTGCAVSLVGARWSKIFPTMAA